MFTRNRTVALFMGVWNYCRISGCHAECVLVVDHDCKCQDDRQREEGGVDKGGSGECTEAGMDSAMCLSMKMYSYSITRTKKVVV